MLPAIAMRLLIPILTMTLFSSCKTEYRKAIDSYPDGKIEKENIYPNEDDNSKYTIIEYYSKG
jgi:hypothetical protein